MAARKRQGPNSDSEAMPQARWRGFHWLHVCQWSERANPATQGLPVMSAASCWLLVLVLVSSFHHEYRTAQYLAAAGDKSTRRNSLLATSACLEGAPLNLGERRAAG